METRPGPENDDFHESGERVRSKSEVDESYSAGMSVLQSLRARWRLVQRTYFYLSVAIFAAMVGGFLAMNSVFLVQLLTSGWVGWVGVMLLLNLTPWVALYIVERRPRLAAPGLALVGFVGGLALSPLLLLGSLISRDIEGPSLIHAALVVTGTVFAAVTLYVHSTKKTFTFRKGFITGLFGLLLVAIPINAFLLLTPLRSNLVMVGIGVLGLLGLLQSTATVLNDPTFDNPTLGARCLFSNLFHVFQMALYFLIGSSRG